MPTKKNSRTAHSRTRKTTRVPRHGLYNSLAPIQLNEFPQNHRAIGLWVDDPYHHHGMQDDVVEINVETCKYFDSLSLVAVVPASEWRSKANSLTQCLIDNIDRVTQELTEHRERLVAELAKLNEPIAAPSPAALEAKPRKQWHVIDAPQSRRIMHMPLWHVRQVHEIDFYIQAKSAETAQANAHVSIGAVTEDGEDVWCGNEITPGVTLVDFDAIELCHNTTVAEA